MNGLGGSMAHAVRVGVAIFAVVAGLGLALPLGAGAEHPAGKKVFREIDHYLRPSASSLGDHLAWVKISDAGPYALAHEAGGQEGYVVLRRGHGRWRDAISISDQALNCGFFPGAVVRDLHLRRYAGGWIPCG